MESCNTRASVIADPLAEAEPAKDGPSGQSPPARRILVVDDSPTATAFAVEALLRAGYSVETSSDMWIAALVSRFQPDLILMDVHLRGGFKGTQAARALRQHTAGKRAQIILYSDMDITQLAELARECGADGFIPKNSDPGLLVSGVARFLEKVS